MADAGTRFAPALSCRVNSLTSRREPAENQLLRGRQTVKETVPEADNLAEDLYFRQVGMDKTKKYVHTKTHSDSTGIRTQVAEAADKPSADLFADLEATLDEVAESNPRLADEPTEINTRQSDLRRCLKSRWP